MKTKHTPGPWTHDPVWSLITACAGKYEIAALHAAGSETTRRRTAEEILANARLIASAPELLEALRECITSDGATAWKSAEFAGRRIEEITRIAKIAIAKAT